MTINKKTKRKLILETWKSCPGRDQEISVKIIILVKKDSRVKWAASWSHLPPHSSSSNFS
jgi:hypothetical protein